jgi:hypothetical protein
MIERMKVEPKELPMVALKQGELVAHFVEQEETQCDQT